MKSVGASFVKGAVATLLCLPWLLGADLCAQGSMNVVLRGVWDNNALPTIANYQYNDVWGYASGGREYGIIGSQVGVHVLDITAPSTPVHVAQLNSACATTRWRDFATYQNYLYVISDNCAGSTFQVFDLSPLPATPTLVYNSNAFFSTAHSITINPVSGRAYIAGANTQMNGIIVIGLAGHPAAPTQLGSFFLGAYTHDSYVHNDTLYAFLGTNGVASFDLVNISNPYQLGFLGVYPESGYAHSGTGIKNNKKLIWIDETQDKGLHVGDIADPYNITFNTTFRSALLAPTYTNSIGHNISAIGDYVYVSYYQDGLQIWNVSNPLSPVRVGYYDTNVNGTYTGMFGAWGIYPNLPSGNILISDTQNGLYILQFNNVFPANMVNFEADALQSRVHLHWTTESETGCRAFAVERSSNGSDFADIAEVQGAGNSTQRLDYSTYDNEPLTGRSYYRLRQMDYDGNVSYGEIKTVDFGQTTFGLSAFPNPAAAEEHLMLQVQSPEATTANVEVFDMMGRRMLSREVAMMPGRANLELPHSGWAAGTYVARLTANGHQVEQKLMITR